MNGDRKVLRLYRDGVLIHAAAADSDFLGWGQSLEEFRANPRLLSLALIEVTYLFCLCYAEVLKDLTNLPETLGLYFYLGGMRDKGTSKPVYLNPYQVGAFSTILTHYDAPAPTDVVSKSIEMDAAAFNPGPAAYDVIEEVYLWFGVEPDRIPYTTEVGGVMKIDPEKIKVSG
jgi:hypothetical protein